MASTGSPERRRPSLVDINLASVERRRKEEPPPISPFSIIVVFLIIILVYAVFPFASLIDDFDIPNLYGVWHEQQEDIDSLKDTLAEKEELRNWLLALAGQTGDLNERIGELESLLSAMELDYTALSQSTVTWSEVLEAIEDAAPLGVTLTSIEEGSSIEISGTAATDALISAYAAALEDTGLFSNVDITEHELEGDSSSSSETSIEACELRWNSDDTVVFTWADSKDYKQGLYSAKQSIASAFSTGLVAYQNVARDLRDSKYIVFWIKSNADQPAGIFQLVFYSPSFQPYTTTTVVKSYTNNTLVSIPDPPPADQWAHSDISVPYADDLVISNVNVYVKITHPARGELIVRVKHPDGTEETVHSLVNGGANINQWYNIPVNFDGKHSYGTWELRALDTVAGNSGSIDTWTLELTGTVPLVPAPTPTPTPAATPTPTATPTAWPTIDYSPLSLCFSASEGTIPLETNPSDQILEIWNSTGGTLNWSVTSDATWLTPTPTSGSSTGEVDYVAVSVDITGPPPMSTGSYTGALIITDTNALNSPQTVPVYLTIREPTMVERLGISALTANTWTEVILQLSNASNICPDYSVALYATHDPGACTLWLDDIRASIEASPGPYTFVITVTMAGGGS